MAAKKKIARKTKSPKAGAPRTARKPGRKPGRKPRAKKGE